jgi:hypothetical protein
MLFDPIILKKYDALEYISIVCKNKMKFQGFITDKQREKICEINKKLRDRAEKKEEKEKLKKIRASYDSKKKRAINKAIKKIKS